LSIVLAITSIIAQSLCNVPGLQIGRGFIVGFSHIIALVSGSIKHWLNKSFVLLVKPGSQLYIIASPTKYDKVGSSESDKITPFAMVGTSGQPEIAQELIYLQLRPKV